MPAENIPGVWTKCLKTYDHLGSWWPWPRFGSSFHDNSIIFYYVIFMNNAERDFYFCRYSIHNYFCCGTRLHVMLLMFGNAYYVKRSYDATNVGLHYVWNTIAPFRHFLVMFLFMDNTFELRILVMIKLFVGNFTNSQYSFLPNLGVIVLS